MAKQELIDNEFLTPCFLIDENEFVRNISCFMKALRHHFSDYILGYSFKTNSFPRLLFLAKEVGAYAEVVSDDEYNLAKRIGYPINKIIFNGPVKSRDLFLEAIKGEALVNIDSQREIEWLTDCCWDRKVEIGIRVNIDLESLMPGHTVTKNQGGRFGFSYENGELHRAIVEIGNNPNVCITRLHMHISNATKSYQVYECLANTACDIIEKELLPVNCIDFGGGYFGGGESADNYEVYASKIHGVLKSRKRDRVQIIIEPGASVVATAVSYLTTAIDIKNTPYGQFVVTDGTRLHIDPFMGKTKYDFEVIPPIKGGTCKQIVCGYSCMEKDRIMEYEGPALSCGDRILYKIVGSYTMSYNSTFISFLPRVYCINDNGIVLARGKQSVGGAISGSRWLF